MNTKTKNINTLDTVTAQVASAAQNVGLVMMAAATTLGLVELGDHPNKIVLTSRPIFAFENAGEQELNSVRREREEAGPHYVSYSVAQRTPGRTGRR